MNIAKTTFRTGLALSAGLTASFAFYAPKTVQAHDIATRIACDVQSTQAKQTGTEYNPSLVCKIAAKL